MKRTLMLVLVAASAALLGTSSPAKAATSVGVDIHIGDPYRGASIHFESAPRMVLVPETKVYYVRDDGFDSDVYRYGRYWYFVEEGRWYRASSYRGPFHYVRVTSVPRSVLHVPTRYRRNWNGPPPHAVARGYHKERSYERGYARGYDHGKHDNGRRGHGRND
jgi:hypothetical protein